MAKHDEYRKNLAAKMREMRGEKNKKLSEIEKLPYWEAVKSEARKEIITNFEKSISDLQSTQEYIEAEAAHKKDLLKSRELWEWDETQDANEYFLECIHKLRSDKYSKEDSKKFLENFFSKNPKLDKNSLYQLKYFCDTKMPRTWSNFEKYIDVFSDIPIEDLLTVYDVSETILDKINFPYDSEGVNLLQKIGEFGNLYKCKKWHDLTKKQVIRIKQKETDNKSFWEESKWPNEYLSMLSEWEVDEEIIYYLIDSKYSFNLLTRLGRLGTRDEVRKSRIEEVDEWVVSIKELLDKYNLNYYKYLKLVFVHSINKSKIEGESLDGFFNDIQTYLNETEKDWFISKDMIETLKKDKDIQLLLKNNAIDIMNYCDKVECDVDFSKMWYDQKFVIWVNPNEKKIKLFSRSKEKLRYHRDFYELPESVGFNIVWWWWIRNWDIDFSNVGWGSFALDEKNLYIYWSSEDFWGFQDYWGLVYRIIKEKFPEKEIKFESWKNPRKFRDDSENSYPSHHH